MLVDDEFLELYILLCKTVSKPDRLRIIKTLGNGKMNVGALQKKLNISMTNLSNHLNELYRAGVLGKEKKGNYVYYYLVEPRLLDGLAQMQDIFKSITSRRNPPAG